MTIHLREGLVHDGASHSRIDGPLAEAGTRGSASAGAPQTIVIIEPRTLIRDCMVRSLHALAHGSAVLAFASIDAWERAAAQHAPASLIVLCAGGEDSAAIENDMARLLRAQPSVPVVILSDVEEADQILEALDHGAQGYIPTSLSVDVAVEALHLVKAGGTFVPASSLNATRRSREDPVASSKHRGEGRFTARQWAVINALRQGKANKQIAYELNMGESTVKVHVRNIMRKLKATNRTQVAVLTQGLRVDQDSARVF